MQRPVLVQPTQIDGQLTSGGEGREVIGRDGIAPQKVRNAAARR
jgi:hypothetical protein